MVADRLAAHYIVLLRLLTFLANSPLWLPARQQGVCWEAGLWGACIWHTASRIR